MLKFIDEDPTCWCCINRVGEECDIDGHEVYEDSKICDQFEPIGD